MTRLEQLVNTIEHHDNQYWKLNSPQISDEQYDELVEELRKLQPNHPLILRVNTPIITAIQGKVKHTIPMLSLDKVYNPETLFKWVDKYKRSDQEMYRLEPKLDGLSADLTNGVLATRGDGEWGENISNKIPIIKMISKDYEGPLNQCNLNKRGEIIVKKDTYEKYKEVILKGDGTQYKTPRGMCSGLLNQDDVDLSLTAVLEFVEFEFFALRYTASQLRDLNWEQIQNQLKEWDYPTDGLVIKLADTDYSKQLGSTSHHPRGQMAFKPKNPSALSTLRNVIWQSGKGKLTPVGVIDPVTISGATITRVSLSNAKNIINKDININDELTVERAGEIIPYVVKVTPGKDRKPINIDSCPECGANVIYKEPEILCINDDCSGKLTKRLADSVARMGFESLAGATIDKLIDIGIENLIDILELTLNDIYQLEGFAEVSSKKLFDEIQRIRCTNMEDWKFVSALNIKGIGKRVSRKILQHLTLEQLQDASVDQLVLIDSIGVERAIEITEYFEKNNEYVDNLKSKLKIVRDMNTEVKLICFTGKADRGRSELESIAETKGFTSTNSVSKDLAILVTNNVNSNTSKMKKAREKGTKIITYDQFYDL